MKKTVILISIFIGTPIAFLVLVMIAYGLNVPQWVGANELYKDKIFFPSSITGDRLIGGGYIFPQGGRDLWVRVHTTANLSGDVPLPGSLSTCSPKSLKKIQAWFLDRVASQKLLGFIPIFGSSQADQEALKDAANLRCGDGGEYANFQEVSFPAFGKPPQDCVSGWVLYHRPSRFYYRRLACKF